MCQLSWFIQHDKLLSRAMHHYWKDSNNQNLAVIARVVQSSPDMAKVSLRGKVFFSFSGFTIWTLLSAHLARANESACPTFLLTSTKVAPGTAPLTTSATTLSSSLVTTSPTNSAFPSPKSMRAKVEATSPSAKIRTPSSLLT